MNLVQCLTTHLNSWAGVLPQQRSLERTTALGVGLLCGVGPRTITRAIGFHGNTQKDWSADYKMFSRSPWEPRELFAPLLREAIHQHGLQRIIVSVDDTRVWRTGQHVPFPQGHRDPLGPAFATNLRWGHRFLQASLVLPLYAGDGHSSARSVPVRWEMAPVVQKPGKGAPAPELTAYRQQQKEQKAGVHLPRGQIPRGPLQGMEWHLLAKGSQEETAALDCAGFDGLPDKQT